MRIVTYREEDDLRLAYQVLKRDVTDAASRRRDSAIKRIVAIVAHHEIMIWRHGIDLRGVDVGMLDAVEGVIADAIGQGLAPALDADRLKTFTIDVVVRSLALDRYAIDIQQP